MSAIKDILDKIDKLTPADQERLKTILFSKTFTKSISIEEFVTKERFANGRVCPVCGATHVVRNGKRKDGTQKYICKDCGKSFVITTNIIVLKTLSMCFSLTRMNTKRRFAGTVNLRASLMLILHLPWK